MRKSNRKQLDPKIKKIRKIAWIILGMFVGLFVALIIIGVAVGPASHDYDHSAESQTAESSKKPATSTTEEKPANKTAESSEKSIKDTEQENQSRKMYQDATSQLYVAQTNLQSDFQLIADQSQGGTDTEALQAYKHSIDLTLGNMTKLQEAIKDGVAESDLKNPDDKLMIDTQLSETVNDFVDIATTSSDLVQTMIDGTTTADDTASLDAMTTKFTNTQYTLQTLEGIGDNNDNWN